MTSKLIPTPEELITLQDEKCTIEQEQLIKSLVEILKRRYRWKPISVKLKEIKSDIAMTLDHDDREALESQMHKKGRKMSYNGPWRNENNDPYYKISGENK